MLKLLQWPFKGFMNFSITVVGFAGLGFWSYSIYSEGKFNQPIIGESIKLLGRNPQIKELVGFPLAYNFSIGNRFIEKEGQSYFSFKVSGPRTSTNVEMTASSRPANEIYTYEQKPERIVALEQQIAQIETHIKDLNTQISKNSFKKQKELMLEKAQQSSRLQNLQQALVQQKYALIQRQNRYFVPSKTTYTKVNDPRSKDSQQPIPKQQPLWGINDLVITLPNRTKMIVYPQSRKSLPQKQQVVAHTPIVDTPTYALFHKKTAIDISELSKEQVLEYGKQKTNFMYSKYGSYRILSLLLFFSALGALVLYKKKTLMKSIKGSILEDEVKRMVSRNENVVNLLRNKQKREAEFDTLIGGGISNDRFECIMYLKSLTNGRVEFSGKYVEEMNRYQFDRMVLKYREKEIKQELDLLK